MKRTPALLATSLLTLGLFASSARAGDVKEANATCYSATAILLAGDGSNEQAYVQRIRETLKSDTRWTIVDSPPQNRVGEVTIVKFDVKTTYKGGPTVAYTVQCGHGGTCNDVANKFREKNPTINPAPQVHCGDLSNFLVNPQVIK